MDYPFNKHFTHYSISGVLKADNVDEQQSLWDKVFLIPGFCELEFEGTCIYFDLSAGDDTVETHERIRQAIRDYRFEAG